MKNSNSIFKIIFIYFLVVAGGFFLVQKLKTNQHTFDKPLFIAHAGGGINGLTYLNSLEAINHNYSLGQRYFEMDFSWTKDNKLVLIHDWKRTYKRLFNNDTEIAPTEIEFLNLKMNFNQTQLSLKQFAQWMDGHPDAFVIADIKNGENIEGIKLLLKAIKKPFRWIIPQMYKLQEYESIKDLGFQGYNIMFAMYRIMTLKDEIIFIKNNHLFAVSIQPEKPYFDEVLTEIGHFQTKIYILTSNDLDSFTKLQTKGVDGLVTDFLYFKNYEILIQR